MIKIKKILVISFASILLISAIILATTTSKTSNSAYEDDGTNVLSQVNESDDTRATLEVNTGDPTDYIESNFTNNGVPAEATLISVIYYFEHYESVSGGVALYVDWWNGTSWTTAVCTPSLITSESIGNCNLSSYINTIDKVNDISLRWRFVKTSGGGATRYAYMDYENITIDYTDIIPTNLNIWDETDTIIKYFNDDVEFFADYTFPKNPSLIYSNVFNSAFEDDTTNVLSQVNVSDDTRATIEVNSGDPTDYIESNFTNANISTRSIINSVTYYFEHYESTTTGNEVYIDWWNGTTWTTAICTPTKTITETTASCDLSVYVNTVDEANDISLRWRYVRTSGGTKYAYMDYENITINYTFIPESSCDISFNLGGWTTPTTMTYNENSLWHEYTKAFTNIGTFDWKATCSADGYKTNTSTDTFTITTSANITNCDITINCIEGINCANSTIYTTNIISYYKQEKIIARTKVCYS